MDPQQKIYDDVAAGQSKGRAGIGFDESDTNKEEGIPGVSTQPAASTGNGAAAGPAATQEAVQKALEAARRLGAQLTDKRKREDGDVGGNGAYRWGKGDLSASLTCHRKVFIPVDEYPDVNFIGLLIGPKGETQKQMEQETGAKILLRGKGASREHVAQAMENEEPLHVLISAESDLVADRAEKLVRDIIDDPSKAEQLKQEQLRRVAAYRSGGGETAAGGGSGMFGPGTGANAAAMGTPAGEEEVSKTVKIPSTMVGFFIGKGGENIRSLQERTGAHVQVEKDSEVAPGATERGVTIMGLPARVEHAEREVIQQIEERKRSLEVGGGRYPFTLSVPIPNDKAGLIIGKGGTTIRGIQERSGANVQVPQGADADDPNVRTLVVQAQTQGSCEIAKREINDIIAQNAAQQTAGMGGQESMGYPGQTVLHYPVPDDRVGIVIGRGGSTVQGIQSRTGTRIKIPQSADPGSQPPVRTVTISGDPQCCEIARAELHALSVGQEAAGAHQGGGGSSYQQQDPYATYSFGGAYDPYMHPQGGGNMAADPYAQQWQQYYAAQAAAAAGGGQYPPADASGADPYAQQWAEYYAYYAQQQPQQQQQQYAEQYGQQQYPQQQPPASSQSSGQSAPADTTSTQQ